MPQASAKRYGLEVEGNLELESRLRRIEVELAALQPANPDAAVTSRGSGAVAQITGLSLDGQIPGGFTVKWNASSIPDLRKYQIQFALDEAFTDGLQTFSAAGISYPFTTGNGTDAAYFCRVRAQNKAGVTGEYSVTLNTSTGGITVDTEDIVVGAVTELATFTQTSGFTALNSDLATETYGPVTVTTFADSIVIPSSALQLEYSSIFTVADGANNFTFESLRRIPGGADEVLQIVVQDLFSTVPTTGGGTATMTAPMIFVPHSPGAGTFEYRIRVTSNQPATPSNSFQGVQFHMSFFVYHR